MYPPKAPARLQHTHLIAAKAVYSWLPLSIAASRKIKKKNNPQHRPQNRPFCPIRRARMYPLTKQPAMTAMADMGIAHQADGCVATISFAKRQSAAAHTEAPAPAEKRIENSSCFPAYSADIRFCIEKTPPALFLCRGCFYMRAYLEEV